MSYWDSINQPLHNGPSRHLLAIEYDKVQKNKRKGLIPHMEASKKETELDQEIDRMKEQGQ